MAAGKKQKIGLATCLAAVASVSGCAKVFFENHTFEFHLEPNRPMVSRVWDEGEEIPIEHLLAITTETETD